jgi:amidase
MVDLEHHGDIGLSGFSQYREYDGLGIARLIRGREVTAQEVLEAAIRIAEAVNPRVNAISQKLYDFGFAAISQVDPLAPFAGVPFLVKDVSAMLKGATTTQGSRFFADAPHATTDTTLVERFKQAGVIIFGKTTTPELGLAPSTETSLTGATSNPWKLSLTAGGSSGGAAAAVATGIAPLAHGSDGGGSIRIPASCCGLFGLKPTRARTPSGPLVGEGWGGLSVHHVLSRSVRDSAAMLDATEGPADGDPYQVQRPERPYLEEVSTPPGRLKIALQKRPLSGAAVAPECENALEDAGRLMETLGHRVEEAQPLGDWDELSRAMWVLVASNVSVSLKRRASEVGRPLSADDVDRVTWSAVEFASSLDVEAYPAALASLHRQGRRMAAFHRVYDLVLSPTLAKPPVPLGVLRTDNGDLEAYRRELVAFMPFTQLFNMTGQPSMTVPLCWSAANIPIGVMLSAAFGGEATLFRIAGQLEAARPWLHRVPSLPQ